MCYLKKVKYCKISAMIYFNFVKQNTNSILCLTMHLRQNANSETYFLNHVIHKAVIAICFIESKHSALSAMCYLNQVKQNTKLAQCII